MITRQDIAESFKELQDFICIQLESIDEGSNFVEDVWNRDSGGGGRTRTFTSGHIIEKGGVNFSEVFGEVTDFMKANTEIEATEFFATGVSIVLHPKSPHIPIIHMNVRYFELSDGTYWFGGGIDLTPHFIVTELAKEFHMGLKVVCDKYDDSYYRKFKKWADDYFYLPHREETRGVGGIFFDHLAADDNISKEQILQFCVDLGRVFPDLYKYQASVGSETKVSEQDLEWMNIRRGRYVEFNLVHDRGTKFGLVSGGRTESILMSMPPIATWKYNYQPAISSKAMETQSLLRKGIEWI